MCGIVGFISKKKESNRSILAAMLAAIRHRGPDDKGMELICWNDKQHLALGHVRLSILDTSSNGHQPMSDIDHDVTIIYNGEVYNAFEYREELIEDGVSLRSKTDTEIIIYLYLKYGIDGMLRKINGMFSFALYDWRTHILYLVRDRMGVKPLYIYNNGNTLMFASEIKAFYSHPEFKAELNENALSEYFMYRYVAGKETLLNGVMCVLPGHYIKINEKGIFEEKYWEIPTKFVGDATDITYEKYIRKSVLDRMLSDVKLGVQLSGGIDSSLVLHYASERSTFPIETYSIIFENEQYSEKKWMDFALTKTGAKKNQLKMDTKLVLQTMEKASWFMDTPITIPNSIGIYLLCRMASEHGVKVLLTGEGADEVLGGYPADAMAIYAASHPRIQIVYEAIRVLSGRKANYGINRKDNYLLNDTLFSLNETRMLLREDIPPIGKERREKIYDSMPGNDLEPDKYLNYKVRTYLVELCMRQDKMAMAASVETRVPFCNYELLELARRQKSNSYIKGAPRMQNCRNKIPLKNISKKLYGKDFTYRSKSGFPLPVTDYYRDDFFTDYVERNVLPWLYDSNIFKKNVLNTMWLNKGKMTGMEAEKLWVIIAFGMWGSKYLS